MSASTIWKFPFRTTDELIIDLPAGARTLCVKVQDSTPCLWVMVNPSAGKLPRRFRIYGTGHPLPFDPGIYIGTYQEPGGALVFHMFEQLPSQTSLPPN